MSGVANGLHETNRKLRSLLESVAPDSTHLMTVTPEQLAAVLMELLQAGEWLRHSPTQADLEMESELRDYRKNVERLRAMLPTIQARLLTERARLEAERAHLEAAAAWARTSRKTT